MTTIALLFPGQGSQHVGMCADLYHAFQSFRDTIEKAEDAASLNIKKLMFDGPDHALMDTENAQPCLVAASCATLAVMKEACPNLTFHSAAGHSLGEYSALVAVGAIDVETAVKLVRKRGQLMKNACDNGGMAAIIGLEREALQACCNEECVIANDNCPGQLVISGLNIGLAEAMEKAKKAGAKIVKKLAVSGPFHSPWMKNAQQEMVEILKQTTFNDFSTPYYPNFLARPCVDHSAIPQLLLDQITGPVRFRETLLHMQEMGVTQCYEVGPGKVLSGLVQRTCPNIPCPTIHSGFDVEAYHHVHNLKSTS